MGPRILFEKIPVDPPAHVDPDEAPREAEEIGRGETEPASDPLSEPAEDENPYGDEELSHSVHRLSVKSGVC